MISWRASLLLGPLVLSSPVAAEVAGVRDHFPFGVYVSGNGPLPASTATGVPLSEQVGQVCRDLVAHHFDTVWLNNLSHENLALWLAAARQHGLRVVPQGGGMPMYLLNQGWWADRWEAAIDARVKPFYIDMAQTHRDDPALLAYSLVEEIPPDSPFFPHIASVTRLVAELAPSHPVIVLYNRASSAERAAREIRPEVIAYDIYPFFTSARSGPVSHHALRSYYEGQIARFERAAASIDAQLWIMAQAWGRVAASDTVDVARQGMRHPTAAEMRYQVWAALFEGARGLFFYAYAGSPTPNGDGYYDEHFLDHRGRPLPHYEEAARISRDLAPLKPLLLRLRHEPEAEIVYWENRPQMHGRTFVHEQTGGRYLMTFNSDVEREQPTDLELGYFQHYLKWEDRLYDLLTGDVHDGQSLRQVMLPAGSGRIYLIGQNADWQRHRSWSATREE